MAIFKGIGEAMDKMLCLNDPTEECIREINDRVTVTGTSNLTTVDQNSVTAARVGRYVPELLRTNVDLASDLETAGERLYYLGSVNWSATDEQLKVIGVAGGMDVFQLLYDADIGTHGYLEYNAYCRFGVTIMCQINATPFQAGSVLVCLMPSHLGVTSWTNWTTLPHAILNCNINDMGRIEVPWVYTRGALSIHKPYYAPWRLYVLVLSPLAASASTSQEVTITILGKFNNLELHGQRPRSNMMRSIYLDPTSFAVNLANKQGTEPSMSLSLGTESFRRDPSIAGATRVTNFRSWTTIPCLMSSFKFKVSSSVGDKIWCCPVTPYHYTLSFKAKLSWGTHTETPMSGTTNLCSIAQQFCHWRCDMVYHFQFNPTKYHSGRIMVCFFPGNEDSDLSGMTIKKLSTCSSAVFDITGTISTLVFRVPWVSDTQYRFNTHLDKDLAPSLSDPTQNKANREKFGIYSATGKLVVLVYSKLRCPSDVPQEVHCNVFVSADNLELMTPSYTHVWATFCAAQAGEDKELLTTDDTIEQNSAKPPPLPEEEPPLKGPPIGAGTCIEDPLMIMQKPMTFQQKEHGQTRHTVDHLDIRQYMGRAHYWGTIEHYNQQKDKIYTLFVDIDSTQEDFKTWGGPLRWFFSMIQLYRGPIDVTAVFEGSSSVDGRIWYHPWKVGTQNWVANEDVDTDPQLVDQKVAMGMICFNSVITPCVKFRVPWYHWLSGISSAMPQGKEDSIHSVIKLQVNNFGRNDEKFRVNFYLSIPDEGECYFMRPCPTNTMLGRTTAKSLEAMRRMELIESSVDPLPEGEEIPEGVVDYSELEKPYLPLRLEVGKIRMQHAFEEWRKGNKGKAKRMLTQSGNEFLDGTLVEKNFAGDIVTGIHHSGRVFYPCCESTVTKNMPGFRNSTFKVSDQLSGWNSTGIQVDPTNSGLLFSYKGFTEVKFNWLSFKKNSLRETFEISDLKKIGNLIPIEQFWILIDCLEVKTQKMVDKLLDGSKLKEDAQDLMADSKTVVKECQELISGMNKTLESFKMSMSSKKFKLLRKSVMSFVRLVVYVFISVKFREEPAIIALCVTMMGLEVFDCGMNVCEAIAESLHKEFSVPKSQGLSFARDLNGVFTLGKNIKDLTLWLIDKIKEFLHNHFGLFPTMARAVIDNQAEIETLLTCADDFVLKEIKSTNKSQLVSEGTSLIQRLRSVFMVASSIGNREMSVLLRDTSNRVYNKLKAMGDMAELPIMRNEPVVVYLHGCRGGGKSLLSMCMAIKLCKAFGVDPKNNIYTKPVSSEYWDNYGGQLVCLIDDMGQNPTDSDWVDFCQIVSTCPLMVNMADLGSKGRSFTSRFIICTSNLDNPAPKTVYNVEAIKRRLHFSVKVKPKDYYTIGGVGGCLDVSLAKSDGSVTNMSCLELQLEGRTVDFDELMRLVLNEERLKSKNFSDLIEIWSQSESSFSSQFKAMLSISKPVPSGSLYRIVNWIDTHQVMVTLMSIGVVAIGAAAVGVGVYLHKKNKSRKEKEVLVEQGVYSGVSNPIKRVVKLENPVTSQSVVDVSTLIQKALCRFGVGMGPDTIEWRVNALNLVGDWFLVTSHAFKFDDPTPDWFYLYKNNTYYCIESKKATVLELESGFQDVVLMKFPGIPKGRDLRGHFVSERDVEMCNNKFGTLCTISGGVYQLVAEGQISLEEQVVYTHLKPDGDSVDLKIHGVWRGQGHTMKGTCGGALVVAHNKLQCPIVGIHVAGGNGQLIAKLVTREMFQQIEDFQAQSTRIRCVRHVPDVTYINAQTQFKKSVLYDFYSGRANVPALMPGRGEVDCISVMLNKFHSEEVEEPPGYGEMWDLYIDDLFQKFQPNYVTWSSKQAILGDGVMDGLDMNTSAGLPYCSQGKTKKSMIDAEGNIIDVALAEKLTENLDCMFKGCPMKCVFNTCAKDELRTPEKVRLGKTRAIECAPVDIVIAHRMVFGPLLSDLLANYGFYTMTAVGINPDLDWHPLMVKAMSFGDYSIDCDFSNFDGTVSTWMIKHCIRMFGELTGQSWTVMQSVYQTLAYPTIKIGNMEIDLEGTVASGCPSTSMINSCINAINTIYCLSQVVSGSYSYVRQYFLIMCYGDDLIIIPRKRLPLPSDFLDRLKDEYSRLGMVVTGSDKGELRMEPIHQMSFLKRKFHFSEIGKFLPAISPTTIYSLLAWTRKKADFQENVLNACWFAFGHGLEFYTEFERELKENLRIARVGIVLPTYRQLMDRALSGDYYRKI